MCRFPLSWLQFWKLFTSDVYCLLFALLAYLKSCLLFLIFFSKWKTKQNKETYWWIWIVNTCTFHFKYILFHQCVTQYKCPSFLMFFSFCMTASFSKPVLICVCQIKSPCITYQHIQKQRVYVCTYHIMTLCAYLNLRKWGIQGDSKNTWLKIK